MPQKKVLWVGLSLLALIQQLVLEMRLLRDLGVEPGSKTLQIGRQ